MARPLSEFVFPLPLITRWSKECKLGQLCPSNYQILKMRKIYFILASLLISYGAIAQPPAGGGNRGQGGSSMTGRFYGKLVESKSLKPVEFASVQLKGSKMD